ncbi:MAG: DUF2029 domain-containing protein [Candidatus Eisenbacteria bacterium]|nr:DUF2029 domain-containing protein [Candidatus Eisenbacteria bacterium]
MRPPLRVTEGGGAPRPPRGAALELAALGAALTFTFGLMATLPPWLSSLGRFQSLYALAFAIFALALLRLRRYVALPHAGLVVFGVALAARLALLPVPPRLSDDLYRYAWEGRVVAAGHDPWREPPLDPALAPLRDRVIWPRVNHPELATIYPPLAEAGFALVARLRCSVAAFKLWVVLHDLALVALLMAILRARGRSPAWAAAYAWNPLAVVEYAGSGHNDPTAMVWLALALLAAERRPVLSALALAAGALVKLAPLLALPFLWRLWPWRARLVCGALLAVGLGWFWAETRGGSSGLHAYWESWRNNELVFHYLERWTGRFAAARALALALTAAALGWAWWRWREPAPAARFGLRAATLVAPVVHPWYLGWPLLFEPLAPSAPWLLLSLTAVLNYGVLAPTAEGRGYHLPLAWRWVEYGAPLLLALVLAAGRRLRRR